MDMTLVLIFFISISYDIVDSLFAPFSVASVSLSCLQIIIVIVSVTLTKIFTIT